MLFAWWLSLSLTIILGGKHHKIQISNPVLADAGQPANPKEQNLYDALSQSSNAYVAKHGALKPKRMQSANASSKNGSRFSKGTKTYYPDEYYKRVGY